MAEGENGAAALKPFERSRLVKLPVCGKTVEVRRWGYTRAAMVNRYLNEIMDEIPDDLDPKKAMEVFYEKLPHRFLEVAKYSLPEEQRAMLDEEWFDHLDTDTIVTVAFEINHNGGGLGKLNGLAMSFLRSKAANQMRKSEAEAKAAK